MTATTRWRRVAALTLILFVLSCVTINVYFPAAEVQAVAEEIVEDVYSSGSAGEASAPGAQSRRLGWPLGARAAYAVDINVSTPAIRTLRANLEERNPKLLPFYESGAVGIGKAGYLQVRELEGLSLKDKADLKKLVEADNTDRRQLYKEIVKANNLEADAVTEVERVFATQWRERARPGWWYQNDRGEWERKPTGQ